MTETLPQFLARVLCSRVGTRKHFSTLHETYLREQEETRMPSTEGLMVPQTEPAREDGANLIAVPVKHAVDPSTCIAKKVDGSDADNSPSK
jgi:hypothetical protein